MQTTQDTPQRNGKHPSDPNHSVPGVERGCGVRQEGGIYLEVGRVQDHGLPLEHFLVDPPQPKEVRRRRGVGMAVDNTGVVHVVDYVGSEHYPWPADVLEEGRRYGFSRRCQANFPFDRLTSDSRLLLVHRRGLGKHPEDFHEAAEGNDVEMKRQHCRLYRAKGLSTHLVNTDEYCCAFHWLCPPIGPDQTPATIESPSYRQIGSTRYRVWPRHDAWENPDADFETALIAVLPLTGVSVIEAEDGSHEATVRKLQRSFGLHGEDERLSLRSIDS